ncbi:MAG: amino acid ABC transporter substrate-binding protein [Chloroflexota bacterium]
MLTRSRLIALCLVLVMAFSGALATAQEGDPILIGASLPLTGGFSIPGSKHMEGYELCVDHLNETGGLLGRPVEIIIGDNRSDVDQAIAQYERLINEDNVDLIFGTFSSRLTFPVSAIAEQNEMVFPIPAAGALGIYEQGFEYLFYFQQNAGEFIGDSPVEVMQELVGADSEDYPATAAVVHADDFFANAIAAGLTGSEELGEGLLVESGIELVLEEEWPGEGFTDWLGLANQIRRSEADILFGLTASPEEVIQIVRALQTVNYQPKAAYFSQGTQIEVLEGVGAEGTNGVLVHSSWHPNADFVGDFNGEDFSNSDFVDLYMEAYDGQAPDEDVAIPFSLCMGMIQAVNATGGTDNALLREWFATRTAEEPTRTILGDFYWDERGLTLDRAFLMLQWQDEELNLIYPVGEFPGTTDLIHPKPEW